MYFTVSFYANTRRFLCLVLVFLAITGFVLTAWSSLALPVLAASRTAFLSASASTHTDHAATSQLPRQSHSNTGATHTRTTLSSSSVNELGLLPFYTYIQQRLTAHQTLSINVANGNLVIASNDLHLAGTGLGLSVSSYYNLQASTSTLCYLNTPWRVDLPDVFLRASQQLRDALWPERLHRHLQQEQRWQLRRCSRPGSHPGQTR